MRKVIDYYYSWRINLLNDSNLVIQGMFGCSEKELLAKGHLVTYKNNLKIKMYSIKRELLYL